ncbi:hypothetical protein GNF86_20675, partial [Clostridium perfringens]
VEIQRTGVAHQHGVRLESQDVVVIAVLARHVNARRRQRNLFAGCTHGFHRCRELLDELEVGVDHLDAGRKRSLNLREAAAQRGELRLTASHGRCGHSRIAIHRHRPVHVHGRLRPLSQEILEEQLGRLGGTVFQLEALDVDLYGDVIVPIRELNSIRRRAVE